MMIRKEKIGNLLEITRVILFQTNVLKIYCSDVILTTNYLINRLSSVILENNSPLEILYQHKINIDHLKAFGCVVFLKIKRKDELDFNSTRTIFL